LALEGRQTFEVLPLPLFVIKGDSSPFSAIIYQLETLELDWGSIPLPSSSI